MPPRVVRCVMQMISLMLGQVIHILIYERGSIVANQHPGDPEPCNNMFSNEVCHSCSSGLSVGRIP